MAKGKYQEWITEELKKPIRWEFQGKEKEFEENIKEHLPDIIEGLGLSPIERITQQMQLQVDGIQIRMDLVVRHEDGTVSIFEVKCPNKKYPSTGPSEQMKAIGQLLLYQSIVKAIMGVRPRLFLVDNKIHYRTMLAFNEQSLPITLIELQKDRVLVAYAGSRGEAS